VIPSIDPVADWLRCEVKAGRLNPTIADSDIVAIAGILLRSGIVTSPKKKAAKTSHSRAVAEGQR
jgi:hypothetical protein